MNIYLKFLLVFYLLNNNSSINFFKNHKKKIIFIVLTSLILKKFKINPINYLKKNKDENKKLIFNFENIKNEYLYFLENNKFNIKYEELIKDKKLINNEELSNELIEVNKEHEIIKYLIYKLNILKINNQKKSEFDELIEKFSYLEAVY